MSIQKHDGAAKNPWGMLMGILWMNKVEIPRKIKTFCAKNGGKKGIFAKKNTRYADHFTIAQQ